MSPGLSRRFACRRRKRQQLRSLARGEWLRRLAESSWNVEFDYLCHHILRNAYLLHTKEQGTLHTKAVARCRSHPASRHKLPVPDFELEPCKEKVITLWQATCICSHAMQMTCEMQTSEGDRCTDVSDSKNAILELQEVLSLRLPSFHRCALRVLGNAADAEDAVQEALCAAYKHIGQFRGQAQMATWLTTIVRNCALMQLRKRPHQIHLSLDESIGEEEQQYVWERIGDGRPNPEEECRHLELCARVQKCAVRLPPNLRRTFQLRVLRGLSTFETARILGLPHGTVKAQLARARAKIARHMRPAIAPRSRGPHQLHR